jgi:hypothetical protein
LVAGPYHGRRGVVEQFLIAWPQYDSDNNLHREIADEARKAEAVAAGAGGETGGIASARNRVRRALEENSVASKVGRPDLGRARGPRTARCSSTQGGLCLRRERRTTPGMRLRWGDWGDEIGCGAWLLSC